MIAAKKIQERLNELRPVYDEIQQKYKLWKNLQTLEQAQAEYKRLTNREEQNLLVLRKRKKELEEEYRRLALISEVPTEPFDPLASSVWAEYQEPQSGTPQNHSFRPSVAEADRLAKIAIRRRVRIIVHRLSLDYAVLGQINRIVDDINSPIGEALILLDWSVFVNRAAHETMEVHLVRLIDWSEALKEYGYRLTDAISNLETRFYGWLEVWELWRTHKQSPEDEANWTNFISESCRVKQDEINRLESELVHLTEEVYRLKAHLEDMEGSL
jgi:predicted nuclease with TOPRIM domain